jgi:hypothetical protein
LNFKNDDQWLNQLNKITIDIQKNTWLKQNLIVVSKIVNEFDDIVTIQYRDVMKTIKFFINHFFFRANLIYASIRQFNDNDERIRIKMNIEDWWWHKQNEVFEKTTIISLLVANDKILLFQHRDDQITWLVYFIIKNLNRETKRNQTRLNDFLLDFNFHAQYSDKNRMKTQIWHKNLSFMLKRKRLKSAFKMSNVNVFFFSIIKNCVQRKNIVIRCANKRFRRCIFWMTNFVCDYEKQMLIVDVKNEQHCIICRVSSKAWKNLEERWSLFRLKFMQEQIRRQQFEELNSRNEKWIHEMKNFV